MSLLTLTQDACDIIGIPRPSTASGSTDTKVRQLVTLATTEGRNLAQRHPWQALNREATWTSVADEDQGLIATIAPGYRRMLSETAWDRDEQSRLAGPLTPQVWQRLKASVTAGPYYRFRVRQDRLYLNPAPSAGHTMAFEFVTEHWCESSAGTGQSRFVNDTDASRIPEQLIMLGSVWRWKQAKGFPYAEDLANYEQEYALSTLHDTPNKTLTLEGGKDTQYPRPWISAPEGSWNL